MYEEKLECMDCKYDDPDDPTVMLNFCLKCKRNYEPDTKEYKTYSDNYKKKRGDRQCFQQ